MKLSKIVNLKKVTLQNYLKKTYKNKKTYLNLLSFCLSNVHVAEPSVCLLLREYKVPLTFFLSVFVSF